MVPVSSLVCAQLNRESGPGATAALAGWIVRESTSPLPARVVAWARHTTLDWLGVAIGGSDSPLVQILTDDVLADGGSGASRLVGRSERTSVAGAALINGAASHVLDFDDVNARMYGHPSVAVVPAVLALAEQRKSRGRNLIEALVVGCEVACRVGDWVGASHDEKGKPWKTWSRCWRDARDRTREAGRRPGRAARKFSPGSPSCLRSSSIPLPPRSCGRNGGGADTVPSRSKARDGTGRTSTGSQSWRVCRTGRN